jgi:hypothetical protein
MKTFGLDSTSLRAMRDQITVNLSQIDSSIDALKTSQTPSLAHLASLDLKRLIAGMKIEDLNSRLAIEESIQRSKDIPRIGAGTPPLSTDPGRGFNGSETEIIMLEYSRARIYKALQKAAENIEAVGNAMHRPLLAPVMTSDDQLAIEQARNITLEKNTQFATKQISKIEFIRKRLIVLFGRVTESKFIEDIDFAGYPIAVRPGYDSKHGTSGFLRKHRSKKPAHSYGFGSAN